MARQNISPLNITILNYHEVTKDARVFKQAKVLANAGHNVTVYCNLLDEMAPSETCHSIKIKRFRCFDRTSLDTTSLQELDFLTATGDELQKRFTRFVYLQTEYTNIRQERLSFHSNIVNLREEYKKLQSHSIRQQRVPQRYRFRYDPREILHVAQRWSSMLINAGTLLNFKFVQLGVSMQSKAVLEFAKQELARDWKLLATLKSIIFFHNLRPVLGDEKTDVVHAHDLMTLPAAIALAQKKGAKVIYDAHEYEPDRTGLKRDAKELTDTIESDCLAKTDRLITVSKGIANLYAERFKGPYPTLIYNTPESVKLPPGIPKLRERLCMQNDVPLVAYIGAVQRKNRGVDKLAAALVELPAYHLVNIGPRNKLNDAWLLEIAKSLNVADRIHLLDPVPAEQVSHVISDATLAAAASQNVGLSYLHSMPNKLFEATFAGLPVCVSDRPDQKEFVGLLGHGIVMDQTDPKAIARAIQTVAENLDKYTISDEVKKLLQSEYSWAAQTNKLLELYSDLSIE